MEALVQTRSHIGIVAGTVSLRPPHRIIALVSRYGRRPCVRTPDAPQRLLGAAGTPLVRTNAMDQVIGVMLVIVVIGLAVDKSLFAPIERFLHRRWGTARQ